MRQFITVVSSATDATDVLVDADPALPARDVLAAIRASLSDSSITDAPLTPLDSSDVPWGATGVGDGTVLRVAALPSDTSATRSPEGSPPGSGNAVLVKQVSGPGAGTIYRLTDGKAAVGSDPRNALHVDDPSVPLIAALIEVGAGGSVVVQHTSASALVTLDGRQLAARTAWTAGSTLRVKDRAFEVESSEQTRASLKPSDIPGAIDFNRPPRLFPPDRPREFRLPTPPEAGSKNSLPMLAMVAPLILAVALAVVFQRPYFLIFGLMSPVMMLGNYFNSRRNGKVTYRERKAKYRATKATIERDAQDAVIAFARERRLLSPDPATAGLMATLPSPRLWERRRSDPMHLSVRVGVAEVPSDVTIDNPEEVDHRRRQNVTASDVPVTVSLAQYGVVGICGPDDAVHRSSAWMVAQLAVTQSPRDVSIVVLTDAAREKEWAWTRWLPHVAGTDAVAMIGNDTRSIGQRLNELTRLIEQRLEENRDKKRDPASFPAVVVVLDGVRRLRQWPGASRVLADGPGVGVYSLCIDSEERLLPEESRAIVVAGTDSWVLGRDREASTTDMIPDLPGWNWFEWVARALTPIRDASDEGDSSLPAVSRFLDVVGMQDPDPQGVLLGWNSSRRSTSVVLGESFDGPLTIDLRRDGPHALIAGTTGAGKSELLQTFIASLALVNRPDEMSFVLIDYKGNAAFRDFADLPHTAGIVTDLDGHLVERAMESLAAELRRRERLLGTVGAKDIEDFTAARERGETDALMPRLVLVIDEFAALKAELPDFVSGIVGIAQRGRSLGIHLVMATQRPAGAITADILANTNLRIALRMADDTESRDVIGTSDAADIATSTPGRAFVRSGASPLLPFQSARIGGPRPSAAASHLEPPLVTTVQWEGIGRPVSVRKKAGDDAGSPVTDLRVLVAAMREATGLGRIERQPSPWLPALPGTVVLPDLPDPSGHPSEVPFGLQDLPSLQDQQAFTIDFEDFSHLFIVGSPRSGRTQTLRTLAGSIAQRTSPNDVHLYGVDFGNGGLGVLTELPHTGAVVTRTQTGLLERFISRMGREVTERRSALAASGFASVAEQRKHAPAAERIPHIVILFDQWEGFAHGIGDAGQSTAGQAVLELLREGASAGVHLVITGDRTLLSPRTGSLVDNKLMLRLADRSDYAIAGLNPREMPERIPDGRAFATGSGREVQVALLAPDPGSQAQATALAGIAGRARQRHDAEPQWHAPIRFQDLPGRLTLPELVQYGVSSGPRTPILGIGGEDVRPVQLDLEAIPTFVVGGPPRSGKSTALAALAAGLLEAGAAVAVMTPLRSPLRALAGHPHLVQSLAAEEITADAVTALLRHEDLVLIVDDASAIVDFKVTDALKGAGAALNTGRLRIIAADGTDELDRVGALSWMHELVKRRHGAVLQPAGIYDGRCIGLPLTQQILAQPRPVGRALVNHGDGRIVAVQVPLV
ncbi:FtsK/SpoIIIE domain-containing protein [Arthrobacter antioxidans]|uniref:FtsK/SpoIIIE domain-containing protein n=1 Tax=Arthrobacter antioxidans TaxID=2895818 RepID=UPI001FFE958A|nr:FtsK/SpoIIIE domain-containing protein [Arthrobacter antioxidans]